MFFQENGQYRCAVYLRLSRSDGDQQESNSIKNQRALLNDYLGKHPELHKVDEYVDDGYSGTNFERPDFKRMMQDIENRKINCIVVKDLSRFGRNYIETGRYLERIFPFMGIRFIAINDHYDSAEENDDKGRILIPFNNLINDTYCRDISMRVRSHLDVKRKEGQSDTIKPRLERCGADCRKVAFINEETYSGLTLDDERIRQAIIEFRPRLVVIDPIQAYLGSDSDLQIAGRARKLMQRLGMWASVYDCAIVLIGHLNKKEGTKGLYRSLGSIDVVAAARSVLQVERDQEDTDIRIVRQIKNSLAPSDGEIRFSITAEMGFQWLECKSTFVSSEQPEVPEFESKTEKAAYLIKKLLSDGDMRAREIYMRMKDEGISRRTAENTKKELGIRSYRKMRQWYWSIHTGE